MLDILNITQYVSTRVHVCLHMHAAEGVECSMTVLDSAIKSCMQVARLASRLE